MAPIKIYYEYLLESYRQIASCARPHRQQYAIPRDVLISQYEYFCRMGATIFSVIDLSNISENTTASIFMVDYPLVAFSDVRVWSLDTKVLRPPTSGWRTYCYGKCGRII